MARAFRPVCIGAITALVAVSCTAGPSAAPAATTVPVDAQVTGELPPDVTAAFDRLLELFGDVHSPGPSSA